MIETISPDGIEVREYVTRAERMAFVIAYETISERLIPYTMTDIDPEGD